MEHEDQMENEIEKKIENKTGIQRYHYFYAAVFLLLIWGAFWLGLEKGRSGAGEISSVPFKNAIVENKNANRNNVDFSLFWNVWDLLKNKYVDSEKLDAQKLLYGAIKGMLIATEDNYTTFFDPEENKKFAEDITGSFEGIGAELGVKNGILTIIAPLEDTPAEKAGLRAGDKILKINGQNTENMTIEEAVDNIRGAKNTEVALTILRNGDQQTKDIKVERNVINVKSVKLEIKNNGVAYLKITRFGEDTNREFQTAIQKVMDNKTKGMVIDLRNNPGGYLQTSIDLASKMLPKDKVVVIEESGDKKQQKMYTRGGDVASGLEAIILINEGSASASEILAGALRDNRSNVTLVGKKSFGKGSVQEFIDLPNETAVKITVARWLTPNGKQINEEGIHPDVEVNMTNEDFDNNRDPQLDKALEILKEKLATQNK